MKLKNIDYTGLLNARAIAAARLSGEVHLELSTEAKKSSSKVKAAEKMKELSKKAKGESVKTRSVIARALRDFTDIFKEDRVILTKMLADLKSEDVKMEFGFTRDKKLCKVFNIEGKDIDILKEYTALVNYVFKINSADLHQGIANTTMSRLTTDGDDPFKVLEKLCGDMLDAYGMEDDKDVGKYEQHYTRTFIGNNTFTLLTEELKLNDTDEDYDILYLMEFESILPTQSVDAIELMTKKDLISFLEAVLVLYTEMGDHEANGSNINLTKTPIGEVCEKIVEEAQSAGELSERDMSLLKYATENVASAQFIKVVAWGTMTSINADLVSLVKAHYDYENH